MRIENYFPGVYISVNTATAFTDSINLSNSQAEQKKESQSWMKGASMPLAATRPDRCTWSMAANTQ